MMAHGSSVSKAEARGLLLRTFWNVHDDVVGLRRVSDQLEHELRLSVTRASI